MILSAIDKQITLADDGQISWQKDLTNPMPGDVIATIKKGGALLAPSCALVDSPIFDGVDKDAVLTRLNEWLARYVRTVLEPLTKLKDDDIAEGAPRDIANKLYDALGVLPREDLQSIINQMDEEKRATLRSKKIRFGPLIVYLPELNKPATVRLRALLLSVWHDKELPADVPADGIVSFSIEGKDLDTAYYRAIGYPIYGPRSVRVDMLDRVVCAIYDGAKDGKFNAQHQMAEWLGSNIADLYAVLEAMGHKKIYDPADEVKDEVKTEEAEVAVEKEAKPADQPEDSAPSTKNSAAPQSQEVVKPKEHVKPELATFLLKKGRAMSGGTKPSRSNKKFDDAKTFSSKKKVKPKNKKPQEQRERVYKAEAQSNPEDSPFAILQQLKVGNKDT